MIAGELASWAIDLSLEDVPTDVQDSVRVHVLDSLGCALAGLRSGVAKAAVTVATDLGGPLESTVLGTATRLGAPAAAYANGVLVHALDFDDTHSAALVHASAVVLPAAFAVGEQLGVSGDEILIGALVGYEVMCRIGAASRHGFHARGLHATKVAGVFAAALTASRLHRLDSRQTVDALGIAGSSAGGLLEFLATGSSTKQLHPGSGAASGILSARLAAAGASGPDSVFEGANGVYAALSARPTDPRQIVDGLGTRWETSRIRIKPYPCCQLAHSSIKAVAPLAIDNALDPTDIDEIVVSVHPDSVSVVCEPAAEKVAPRSSYDAKFSLPWTLAALIHDGSITVDSFSEESVARPALRELATRVRSVVRPSDAPAADAPGDVSIHLRNGQVVQCHFDPALGAGTPDFEAGVYAKLLGNLGGDREWADRLVTAVRGLGHGVEVSEVLRACSMGASTGSFDAAGASR